MEGIKVEGSLRLESDKHVVEYDADGQTGAGTAFLRLEGENQHNVPIYHRDIDVVINMLIKMKKIISTTENEVLKCDIQRRLADE